MKAAAAAFLFFASVLAASTPDVQKGANTFNVVPNRFIIEVSNVASIPGKRSFVSPHDALFDDMRKRGVTFDVEKKFNSPGLLVGASVTLSTPEDIAKVATISGVTSIRPVILVPPPKPVSQKVAQSGQTDVDTESTHILTGVDKLHAQNIFGAGVNIGIVDTGIDYAHPNLQAAYAGGQDYVGDAFTGSNTPQPDNDPLDQCNGHGTHVAGIIAASPDNEFQISGVAYQAKLKAYRVFGCSGSTPDDIIIQAMLQAVADGNDVITLSLGGASGWTEGAASVVASRIAKSGKVVTIAAGNDGQYGSWYTSGPGNGIDVISVASLENTKIPSRAATVTTTGTPRDPIAYFTLTPLDFPAGLPLYATSTDTSAGTDACGQLPPTLDLSNKLVIIRRGGCTFALKLQNVKDRGAQYVLIYNNQPGYQAISTGDVLPTALISATDGAFLVNAFATSQAVTLSFPQSGGTVTVDNPTGGLISTFTSYGPSNDMFFKPAVAAPGGNIISTYPVKLGSFAILSGTSMATPFTAGVAALVLSQKGKTPAVAKSMRDLLQTNAAYVPQTKDDNSPPQTVSQQGAGLVNAFQAVTSTTVVAPGQLTLNDTAFFKGFQTFGITNKAKAPVTYRLSHVPAGTAQSIQSNSIFPSVGPVPQTTQYGTVKLSQTKVTVRPGGTANIIAVFAPPKGIDATTYPVYGGFIQIQNVASGEISHVSYLGVANALKSKQVLDTTSSYTGYNLPAILDDKGQPQTGPKTYNFQSGTQNFPSLLWRQAFGTPVVRADLVNSTFTLPAPAPAPATTKSKRDGSFGLLGWFWPQLLRGKPMGSTFDNVQTIGPLFELDWLTRNSNAGDAAGNGYDIVDFTTATFANGTAIPNGQYKVLLRALKVTGNPIKEEDYEAWLSPVIGVQV